MRRKKANRAIHQKINTDTVNLIRLTGMRESEIRSAKKGQGSSWEKLNYQITEHKHVLELDKGLTRQKAIQDPIYGAILFEPWELDMISGWEMLRLRFVKQLGPAHLVYPGATHTRFEHCLGTNFLAQKCIRVVNYADDLSQPRFEPLSRLLDDYHQKIFRSAALLHDVGHPPTSHTIEFALKCWAGLTHIDLGEFLIMHSGLTEVLERNDIEPKVIVDVLRRRTNDVHLLLLSEFLDSPLDLDKTDYLIRDAHFSGVQLGVFPAERVMLTNRVVKHHKGQYVRAFMMKALHSLESLILSRNWMMTDLYLHHAVRVAEALTSKATYFRIEEENLSKNECLGFFTRMTDADLYHWLSESNTEFVRDYAARIRYRRLFKVALSKPLAAFQEEAQKLLCNMRDDIEALIEAELALDEKLGSVIIDVVDPELLEKDLGGISLLIGGEISGFDLVKLEDTQEGKPLMQAVRMQKHTIPSVRVYADPDKAERIRKKFTKLFPISDEDKYIEQDYDDV